MRVDELHSFFYPCVADSNLMDPYLQNTYYFFVKQNILSYWLYGNKVILKNKNTILNNDVYKHTIRSNLLKLWENWK